MSQSEGTLLVPVANPDTVARLLDTAIDLARDRSMRIVVLNVVEVPPQIPLSDGDVLVEDDGEEERLLATANDRVTEAGVQVETTLRYARDVATGIVGAVDNHGADALLLGWRGRPRRRDIVLGSFVDRILAGAPCDVFVKRIRSPDSEIDSILVPVGGGPHTETAVDCAGSIADQRDAAVTLVTVLGTDAPADVRDDATDHLADHADRLSEKGPAVEPRIVENDHVAGALTDETANHDLTVLGASEKSSLKRTLVGSVAEGVGRAAASQVILARSGRVVD